MSPAGATFRLTLFVGGGDCEGVVDFGGGVGVGSHFGHGVRVGGHPGDLRQRDEVLFARGSLSNPARCWAQSGGRTIPDLELPAAAVNAGSGVGAPPVAAAADRRR